MSSLVNVQLGFNLSQVQKGLFPLTKESCFWQDFLVLLNYAKMKVV